MPNQDETNLTSLLCSRGQVGFANPSLLPRLVRVGVLPSLWDGNLFFALKAPQVDLQVRAEGMNNSGVA